MFVSVYVFIKGRSQISDIRYQISVFSMMVICYASDTTEYGRRTLELAVYLMHHSTLHKMSTV